MDAAGLELLRKMAEGWTDAFGDQVAKGQRNSLDLPAFYSFSEERYRFLENGTRIRTPDADSTRFTDQDEQFLIEPQAGDTLAFTTAEKPRYIVGNDAAVSWSFRFLTGLQDADDTLALFLGDAFEIKYDGTDTVTLRAIDDGVTQREQTKQLPNDAGAPTRPELTFNWYAVGRAELVIDYTEESEQVTSDAVRVTVDDDWLSGDPTGRMGFRLDVASSGVQLEAGSMAFIPQTDTAPTSRPKPHVFSSTELNGIPATGYGVLGALRIDPDRDNVFVTLTSAEVTAEESVDVEVTLKAVPEGDTDADFLDPDGDGTDEGPAYPRSNSPQNSVIQWTPNVSTFPTRTYTVDGTQIPNGRSVGAATEGAAGVGSGVTKTGRSFRRKRPVYADDVVLIMGHTPDADTAATVDVFLETDQEW
jgi:hypothetical protein